MQDHQQLQQKANRELLRIVVAIIGLAAVIAIRASRASASEYGVSTYRTGIMDMFAGYSAAPGDTVFKSFSMYQDAKFNATTANGRIDVHAHTVTYTEALFGIHVTHYRLLGSNWAFGGILQSRIADQTLKAGPPGHQQRQTDTAYGLGDTILAPYLLGWTFGHLHLTHSLMIYTPTGDYDRHHIIDIGLNRWAVEPDVGMTWMDEEKGRQASAFIGYTINVPNTSTHYRSGDEFHADFMLAQHLPYGLVLGMAGYAFQQTTADSGSGDNFGAFKGRVIALGPLAGATVKLWNLTVNLSVKYEFEFASENRSTGNELWLTASFRL